MIELIDNFNRVHNYLRISLTDRCNLNCLYCNPAGSAGNEKSDILNFEELRKVINIFVKRLGIKKIRFTGGEPFARKDVLKFFETLLPLKEEYNLKVGVTTNGTLTSGRMKEIRNTGIDSINISLDTLDHEKFKKITGQNLLGKVLDSIQEAEHTGFKSVKINSVIIRGLNDDEVISFIRYFQKTSLHLRFIEFMPSKNNKWGQEGYISAAALREIIEKNYLLKPVNAVQDGVSKNFKLNDSSLSVGLITPISHHFCNSCNRLRITSKGELKSCLFGARNDDVNFKSMLNLNYSEEDICALIAYAIRAKWRKHPGISRITRLQENNMLTTGG